MQIVSEIAEIVASAIDCVLVLWFLTSHFGKKKTIEWWKYAVWFVILFIPSHFMGEMFNLQSIIVILIVTSFSMIYLQGNSIEKLIVSLILYIMLAFVNIMVIQVISVLSKSPMEVLISGNDILRILVLCISKVTVILTFVIVERGFSKKHYFKKEEYIFGAVLYITFFIVAVLTVKIVGTVEMTFREQMIFFILTMLLLVINSFMFWLIRKMNYQNRCELENEVLKVQLEQQESQIHNTELLYQNTRKMRHDMKHYFTTYLQLLRDGETEVVIQEMQSILETELEAENVFYMESRMVNAVINQKAALCKKNKISLEVQIVVVFTTLRSCCGGYHASKAWQCNLLTVVLWGMVIAGTYTEAVMKKCETLTIAIAVVSELVIYQCAPVEHQNKKLTNEKKVRNRRCALGLGMIYGILILLLTFSLTRLAIALALTVLEVVILMIIPSEGRSNEP